MGSRPNADIGFGVYLGSEGSWHNDPDWASFSEPRDDMWAEFAKELGADDAWDAEESCPVMFIHGGMRYDECQSTAMIVRSSHVHGDWDDPTTVALDITDRAACIATLMLWAERFGFPWEKITHANPDGPRWLMMVSYG